MEVKKTKKNEIISLSFLTEKIVKSDGSIIFIVRGGSPQMPQTLFFGYPDEYCDWIHNM